MPKGPADRKAPAGTAKEHPVGTVKTGEDGGKWIVAENKNGNFFWQKHK
jgi:hypothetical protein